MKKLLLTLSTVFCALFSFAQLPSNVLVGYHENWNTLKLSQINSNYNVICLAFALPSGGTSYNMQYTLPAGYTSIAQMITDIDALHAQGKKVLLSIGGATAYIYLNNTTERDAFVTSINNIMAAYSYKIDGIDLDLEKNINTGQNSMAFGSTWTMAAPAAAQTHMVNAVKNIMSNYQTQTGKKMLLTAAPEAVYLMGALSTWQINNANGGAFLPILDGLRNEIDCLHMQLYNAGGASGGIIAWNNTIYYDDGTIAFALAMNESIIKGFTLLNSKGTFTGIPASKIAFGFPATSAPNAAGTGYVTPTNVCNAVKYFKGQIAKPAGCTYTMTASYPTLKGLMTWSINEDSYASYPFAGAYTCAFAGSAPVANFNISNSSPCIGQSVTFTDASSNTPTSWAWNFGSGASIATANTQGPHSLSYSTAGSKTISLTATNGNGSNAINQNITVLASVGAAGSITGSASPCQNSSQNYSITAVANATTYTWTVPSGSSITAGQGTPSITVTIGANAGNITVTPSNACGNGTAATKPITISPTPSAAGSITGPAQACAGTTLLGYSIANVSGATNYTWTVPAGSTITAGQGTTSITVTAGSTSGNVAVTPSNSCGNGTAASTPLTINTAASAAGSISGSPSVCANATGLVYSIAGVSGATSYTWTVPTGASITAGQGTNSITVTMGANSGNITVTPISTCGNGTAASLAVNTAGGSTPLVEGFETSVPPSGWSLNNADNATTWTRTTTAFASGTASAKMTFFGYNTNLGTKDELQTQALSFAGKINHTLTFKHAYAWMDRTGTANDRRDSMKVLISTDCGSSWTQLFYKGGNTLSTLTNGAGQQAAFTPTSGQWVTNNIDLSAYDGQNSVIIKFVAINRNGNNLYLDDININGTTVVAPVANFTTSTNQVCAGQTVTFTNTSTGSPTSFSWDFGAGASPATSTSAGPIVVTYSTAGTATVSLTVSNTAGSNNKTSTNLITVDPLPSAAGSISGSPTSCASSTGNVYSISPVSNATTYTWTVPAGSTITSGQGTTSITVTFGTTSGNVTVTPTNTCGNGSAASKTVTLTATVSPSVSISATQNNICTGNNVTFTATPTNGGTPSYQWKLNGGNVGTNQDTYNNSSLANGDIVSCEMTSNASCLSSTTAISNSINMTVSSSVTPLVSIAASQNNVCAGTSITFTATPSNGGAAPTYQWKLNSNPVGTNSSTYSNSSLVNGDVVSCEMTSNANCLSKSTATSNDVTMLINANVTPSVSIAEDQNNVCEGTSITFTATPTNGGTPSYQWKVDGNIVGTNSSTFSSSSLVNGEVVTVEMTSNATCATPGTVTSNGVTAAIISKLTPTISIVEGSNNVCAGDSVAFTSNISNGGANPSYQWKVNSNNAGTNSNKFKGLFNDNDVVICVLTSDATCITGNTANSNSVVISVNPLVTPSVSISASKNSICPGENVTFSSNITNGGTSPIYQWKLNGNNVGANNPSFSSASLVDADVVSLIITSNDNCLATINATSNDENISYALITPSVALSVNDSDICYGTQVDFTATPTNGGITPSYVWKVNNINSGTGSSFSSSSLIEGDVVEVEMTSSDACASPNPVNSSTISMTVNTLPNSPGSISGLTTVTAGDLGVTYDAVQHNGLTYTWNYNGVGVINNNGSSSITLDFDVSDVGGDLTVSTSNSCGSSAPTLVTISVNPLATAIQNSENEFNASIYPNPFTESTQAEFTLSKNENFAVKLLDAEGRLIKNYGNLTFASGKNILPINGDVEAGIYFLQFIGEEHEFKLTTVKID